MQKKGAEGKKDQVGQCQDSSVTEEREKISNMSIKHNNLVRMFIRDHLEKYEKLGEQ